MSFFFFFLQFEVHNTVFARTVLTVTLVTWMLRSRRAEIQKWYVPCANRSQPCAGASAKRVTGPLAQIADPLAWDADLLAHVAEPLHVFHLFCMWCWPSGILANSVISIAEKSGMWHGSTGIWHWAINGKTCQSLWILLSLQRPRKSSQRSQTCDFICTDWWD